MMLKTNFYLFACTLAAGLFPLSGCGDTDRFIQPEGRLQIDACIVPETGTGNRSLFRATASPSDYDRTSFQAGDVIKVERKEPVPSGLAPVSCTYTCSSTGWVWTEAADEPDGPFYIYENGEKFTATFPANHAEILADQSTGANFLQSNRLAATAAASGGKVSFTFLPVYTKITVIIYYQTQMPVPAETLTLTAVNLRGGVSDSDESVKSLCKTTESATEHTWSAIISPGTHVLNIKLGNSISYTAAGTAYAAATHYTYTLYRKQDRLEMDGTVTITSFGAGVSGGDEISAT